VNFTREPIIETVITPREGCTLVVRNSKGNGQEDYFVDAVEVVSFGHSFFFRSQERPKSFLVPVSDYEILELKETRMVLKNVSSDRSIKIGGGREAAPPRAREEQPPQDVALTESRPAPAPEQRPAGKRDNKRRRGRRGRDRPESQEPYPKNDSYSGSSGPREQQQEPRGDMRQRERERYSPSEEHQQSDERDAPSASSGAPEEPKAPSFISKLFPPPTTLIRENLSRYKIAETEGEITIKEKETFEETIFEHPSPADKELEDESEE
jgi:hypothetical protein